MTSKIPKRQFKKVVHKKNSKKQTKIYEKNIQKNIIDWVRKKYPKALTNGSQAGFFNNKKSGRDCKLYAGYSKGFPDFQICEPSGIYHGCFIEFKRPGAYVKIPPNEKNYSKKIYAQFYWLTKLKEKGYCIGIIDDIEEGKKFIKKYFSIDKEKRKLLK